MPNVIKYFDELSDTRFFRQNILARIYLFMSVMFDELMLLNTQRSRGFETRDSSWPIIFYFIFFSVFENRDYVREFPIVRNNANTQKTCRKENREMVQSERLSLLVSELEYCLGHVLYYDLSSL